MPPKNRTWLDRAIDPYGLVVSAGEIDNHATWRMGGGSDTVGASNETVWHEGGQYVFPTSASTMTISSDSANDTAAGTGATLVRVSGLDSDYLELVEYVITNGTSGVSTVNSFFRINELLVVASGTSEWNEGNIYIGTGTITAGKPANVYNLIQANESLSHTGVYTVPVNRAAYVDLFYFGTDATKTVFLDAWVYNPLTNTKVLTAEFNVVNASTINSPYSAQIPPQSDIWFEARTPVGTASLNVLAQGVIRNEDY